ncbi:MAG: hypothetical protein QOH16_1232, partial [Gaiellaceae bacterium]|nr:hypothetical protein [Gaiellaceae bacterium]
MLSDPHPPRKHAQQSRIGYVETTMRVVLAIAVALALPAAATARPHTVKPDRVAINRLLDEF